MISGTPERRRRLLFWALVASALLHLVVLTVLFHLFPHTIVLKGVKERISETDVVKIEKQAASTPHPSQPVRHVRHVRQRESPPAAAPRHELAKQVAHAPPQPPRRHPTAPSRIVRDEAGFAREVAQLNKQNDPHAIPTIDPASQGSTMKSYRFDIPSSMRGDEHGNGIITPTQAWRDRGLDCYYGRYEFTYPDGAMEDGNIPWPFCYDPGSDPFKLPPHPMPFPLPPVGYTLPPGTPMPPIEKGVYDQWAGDTGARARSTPK